MKNVAKRLRMQSNQLLDTATNRNGASWCSHGMEQSNDDTSTKRIRSTVYQRSSLRESDSIDNQTSERTTGMGPMVKIDEN